MSKVLSILDNEGNTVKLGDEIIAVINIWRGRDEAHRGTVTSVAPTMVTADFVNKGSKRVKNTKFIRVVSNKSD